MVSLLQRPDIETPRFTPKRIAGLVLWLDASKFGGADASAIATWPDQSGLRNHATQATEASQPLLKLNIIGSKPVVRFDGTDDFLTIGTNVASLELVAGTWIVVIKVNDNQAITRAIIACASLTAPRTGMIYSLETTTGLPQIDTAAEAVPVAVKGTNAVDDNTAHILMVTYDGATATHYKNGALNGSGALALPTYIGDNFAEIGALRNDAGTRSNFHKDDIAELILYDHALTQNQSYRVERYLRRKYGIARTS